MLNSPMFIPLLHGAAGILDEMLVVRQRRSIVVIDHPRHRQPAGAEECPAARTIDTGYDDEAA